MKERFMNETKLPTESLSKSMGTSEKMSEIENLNSELLMSSAQYGGAKNSSKILIYTNMCDFRLVDKRNICLFQYNHELRNWEVVVDGTNSPIRLKRNLKSDLLMNLGEQFVQVNQKIIINVDFLSAVVDSICHFYPPFDHLDYVRISRIYRRKFIEHFLAL